jgi:hypothetical protein
MWYIYWNKSIQRYQLSNTEPETWMCVFQHFQMAVEYVTKANGPQTTVVLSRWAQ